MERKQLGRDGPDRLGHIDVLCDLTIGRRRELARFADEVTAEAGELVLRQGEPGYEFMLLEDGRAEVIQDGERVNLMGPGDCFGELAVLSDGSRRTASVLAVSKVRAIVLTAHFMREVHDLLPAVGERIDQVADERIQRDAQRRSPPSAQSD